MTKAREKIKISFDIKTFIVIVTTIWSISYWGSSILNKINNMDSTLSEQKVIIKEIAEREQNYEKRLAWIEPAVEMMMKKMWFK